MLDKLMMYLQMPNVQYAFIVAILISISAALLGVSLVLKRFSFIGDGLSHVAFGALAIASVMKLTNNMMLILPVTILAAIILLRTGKKTKIKGDSAIAMLSVGSMAFGYLLLNLSPTSSNITGDVCTTLFGSLSIITLEPVDVIICAVLAPLCIITFVLLYNRIFAVTFDEDFATATGTRAEFYNLIIAIITAIIIVLAMNLVGSLLITALLVFPALSAMRLSRSFKKVTVIAAIFSVICAVVGLLIAILFGTPVGSTIVACDAIGFAICLLIGKIIR